MKQIKTINELKQVINFSFRTLDIKGGVLPRGAQYKIIYSKFRKGIEGSLGGLVATEFLESGIFFDNDQKEIPSPPHYVGSLVSVAVVLNINEGLVFGCSFKQLPAKITVFEIFQNTLKEMEEHLIKYPPAPLVELGTIENRKNTYAILIPEGTKLEELEPQDKRIEVKNINTGTTLGKSPNRVSIIRQFSKNYKSQ